MGKGIFGGLFDFNRDGEMSAFERATEFAVVNKMIHSSKDSHSFILEDEDDEWRDYCEDGFEYGLDPENYETEEEYEEALEEAKADLREAESDECSDLVLSQGYETEIEYEDVLAEAAIESQIVIPQECDAGNKTKMEMPIRKEPLVGKTIYHYCGVVFEGGLLQPYHYRTEDTSLKIGDKVVVPVGPQNEECIAQIVSVEQHTRVSVPYPVEKTKYILRKYIAE